MRTSTHQTNTRRRLASRCATTPWTARRGTASVSAGAAGLTEPAILGGWALGGKGGAGPGR